MIPKCNPELVEAVFELMFETLWLAPYDRRRRSTVYIEYEVCVRHAVRLLNVIDLSSAGREQREQVSHAARALADSIRRLCAEGIFPADRCEAASEVAEEIVRVADNGIAVEQM